MLFLDEFGVSDLADAQVTKRLFKLLFHSGAVLVAASPHSPEQLYANGIRRASFLPFVPLLRRHCIVTAVTAQQDFRLQLIKRERKLFSRLYHGRKLRKGPEKVFQTFFCVFDEDDMAVFG